MAMASPRTHVASESAGHAAGSEFALIRSAARSRREIARRLLPLSNSRPVPKLNAHVRTMHTWAFVTIMPSLDQITPDPFPRPPE